MEFLTKRIKNLWYFSYLLFLFPKDLSSIDHFLSDFKKEHSQLELWLEPGRYIVASSGMFLSLDQDNIEGVLLSKVTQTKSKEGVNYVGLDTGFNSLIRPVLYSAYHVFFIQFLILQYICNLSQLDKEPNITSEIVGPICESGDVFGHNRR